MKRVFTKEFKLMVVDLINVDGKTVSEVSKFFDIDRQVIHIWLQRYNEKGAGAFDSCIPAPHENAQRKIERELREQKEENELLKKALAYFGKITKG